MRLSLRPTGPPSRSQRWAACINLALGIAGLCMATAGPAAFGAKEFAVAGLAIAGIVNVAIGVYVLLRR